MLIKAFDLLEDFEIGEGETFKDIKEGDWYEIFIRCAQDIGLTNGIGENLFGIGEYIKRQDMVTLTTRTLETCRDIILSEGEETDGPLYIDQILLWQNM